MTAKVCGDDLFLQHLDVVYSRSGGEASTVSNNSYQNTKTTIYQQAAIYQHYHPPALPAVLPGGGDQLRLIVLGHQLIGGDTPGLQDSVGLAWILGESRLPTSIGNSVRFNWPHIAGESRQLIDTVGNPPSQCRSLGTYTVLRVKCGSLGTYTLTAD